MSQLIVNPRWMLVFKIFILFLRLLLQNHFCEASGPNRYKNILFISAYTPNSTTTFPTRAIFENGTKLCFNIHTSNSECCNEFNCNTKITGHENITYNLTLNETTLDKHDIVVLLKVFSNYSCLPSMFNSSKDFMWNLHKCLKPGGKNIRLSKEGLCGNNATFNEKPCSGPTETQYLIYNPLKCNQRKCTKNVFCKVPGEKPEKTLTFNASKTPVDTAQAANIMNDLGSTLSLMGNASTAEIKMGNVIGVIAKLPKKNQTSMSFGFVRGGGVNILKESDIVQDFSQSVYLPQEASKMAVEYNGTFAGVLVFPDIPVVDESHSLFNNEMLGIEMGANIFNLSQTINIHFSKVNRTGFNATCVSWDGKTDNGTGANWTTEGCLTEEVNGIITCECSHLTFFAILMSPFAIGSAGNQGNPSNSTGVLSSSDLKTLTQITKAGCGMSMFFLGVALFMHFLLRKNKASQAVKILINLFVALFILNFCFLINDSIANLKNLAACVAMGAILHYSMLSTFTWFFMQALHLYFSLHKMSKDFKYYMCKICTTGWVIPAVVVVGLLASNKYDFIIVSADNATAVTMCWIPDAAIHTGVNIGYYSVVFIFTLTMFIVTVVQIKHFSSKKDKSQDNSSTKKRFFSLLGLFCLLGLTWGFAFFSYGPLLLPSYYIFTILNSFQGFFLFVYYYFSSRIVVDEKTQPTSSSSATTKEEHTSSPYG